MSNKALIEKLEERIKDIHETALEYKAANQVPSVSDSEMTYGYGEKKTGKLIETCVLYVDVRDSVKLVEKHQYNTMGKVYSAFTEAILRATKHHGGSVRNIIGDRVMVVFPEENCFTNAVDCAISINHSSSLINKEFSGVKYKAGIGIDYGKMRVLKVGLKQQGAENYDNKNLVWVGSPANIASRLTDVAGKSFYSSNKFKITIPNQSKSSAFWNNEITDLFEIIDGTHSAVQPVEYFLTGSEILRKSKLNSEFQLEFMGKIIQSIIKDNESYDIPKILASELVYEGLKNENPNHGTFDGDYWEEVKYPFKNVKMKVFGMEATWKLN